MTWWRIQGSAQTYKPQTLPSTEPPPAPFSPAVAVRLKHDGLPEPGALGFFTGMPTSAGRRFAILVCRPWLVGSRPPEPEASRPLMKGTDPKDPLASPIYADLKGLPPTLCITGTRDLFLSATSTFHRALLRAGVQADWWSSIHAACFWFEIGTPESKEALEAMAKFFDRHLEVNSMNVKQRITSRPR